MKRKPSKADKDWLPTVWERNAAHYFKLDKLENERAKLRGETAGLNKNAARDRMHEDMFQVACGEKEGASPAELTEYFKDK